MPTLNMSASGGKADISDRLADVRSGHAFILVADEVSDADPLIVAPRDVQRAGLPSALPSPFVGSYARPEL